MDTQPLVPCPETSIWVDASAGTGKTKTLVDRLVYLLVKGVHPDSILCLTFTQAAAQEMLHRVMGRLEQLSCLQGDPLTQALTTLLGHPPMDDERERASQLWGTLLRVHRPLALQTIHQFCADLLTRFSGEAGLGDSFRIMDEVEGRLILDQALTHALEDLPAQTERDPFSWGNLLQECFDNPHIRRVLWEKPLALTLGAFESFVEDAKTQGSPVPSGLIGNEVHVLLQEGTAADQRLAQALKSFSSESEAYQALFLTQSLTIRKKIVSLGLQRQYPHLEPLLQQEAERLYHQVQGRLRASWIQESRLLITLLYRVFDHYQGLKAVRHALDFDDLLQKAHALLHQHDLKEWLLYCLDRRFDHILVDEAQDTNPLQWDLIKVLCEDFFSGMGAKDQPRSVFVVGDFKQAIYRFQGADPTLFLTLKTMFKSQVITAEKGWLEKSLTHSYRSNPLILGAVDAVFAQQQVPFQTHESARDQDPGQIALWPLQPGESLDPMEAYAQEIEQWLGSGRILAAKGRAVQARDILILFQRRHAHMFSLIQALKKRGIAVAGPDRLVLNEQLIVQDLLAFLRWLHQPQDAYALACLLKSPLVGLAEEDLMQVCQGRGKRPLWEAFLGSPWAEKGSLLQAFVTPRRSQSPYRQLTALLYALGGEERYLQAYGMAFRDVMQAFLDKVLELETAMGPSLIGVITWFEENPCTLKRDFSGLSEDAVRVMTVHGAKGLQAPIVLLLDTTRPFSLQEPFLWVETPQEPAFPLLRPDARLRWDKVDVLKQSLMSKAFHDSLLLLYVAMTRAEDELYIGGWEQREDEHYASWYRLICQGLAALNDPRWVKEERDGTISWTYGEKASKGLPLAALSSDNQTYPSRWLIPLPRETKDWSHHAPSHDGEALSKASEAHRVPEEEPLLRDPLLEGLVIHKALEDPQGLTQEALQKAFPQASEALLKEALSKAQTLATHPLFMDLFGPQAFAEVPVMGDLDGRRYSGKIDRLIVGTGLVRIVDFKTDRHRPENLQETPLSYVKQLDLYARLVRKILPTHTVQTEILWVRHQDLQVLNVWVPPLLERRNDAA
jgi:ATP-dependent helicase/nuclease subunit A